MKKINKIVIVAILLLLPGIVKSQNWIMAREYVIASIDTIIKGGEEDYASLINYNLHSFSYDSIAKEYHLYIRNESDSEELMLIDFKGSNCTLTDDGDFPLLYFEVPDLSGFTYLYNASGNPISYAVSCNDSDFKSYNLKADDFKKFKCAKEDPYLYIKINSNVNEPGSGTIQKLKKGAAYSLKYDESSKKIEVYLDNRCYTSKNI
jgi:hypothetical protein